MTKQRCVVNVIRLKSPWRGLSNRPVKALPQSGLRAALKKHVHIAVCVQKTEHRHLQEALYPRPTRVDGSVCKTEWRTSTSGKQMGWLSCNWLHYLRDGEDAAKGKIEKMSHKIIWREIIPLLLCAKSQSFFVAGNIQGSNPSTHGTSLLLCLYWKERWLSLLSFVSGSSYC